METAGRTDSPPGAVDCFTHSSEVLQHVRAFAVEQAAFRIPPEAAIEGVESQAPIFLVHEIRARFRGCHEVELGVDLLRSREVLPGNAEEFWNLVVVVLAKPPQLKQ